MKNRIILRVIAFLLFFESIVVGSEKYLSLETGAGLLSLGTSIVDLIILFTIIVISLFFLVLVISGSLLEWMDERINQVLSNQKWLVGIIIILSLFIYEAFQDYLFLKSDVDLIHYAGYRIFLDENIPLLGWVFIGGLQLLFLVMVYQWQQIKDWLRTLIRKRIFYIYLGIAVLVLLAAGFGIGDIFADPNYQGFNKLNAPLLGIQVLLIGGGFVLGAGLINKRRGKWSWLDFFQRDWIIMILIFLITFAILTSVPVGAKSFTDPPSLPNNEFYPSSDSLYYEHVSFQYMVGNGMLHNNHVGFPIYLAFLHVLGGDGYVDILPIQLALMSLIPILLYKLTSTLHSRFSGLVVSSIYLVRETNALYLGEHITLSNAGELMTEPLAAFGVILFSTLIIVWMHDPKKSKLLPLLSGAVMGWMVLVRVEVLAMIPAVGLIMLIYFRKNLKLWFQGILMVGVGVLLLAGPWMGYIYAKTGSPRAMLLDEAHHLSRVVTDFSRDHPTGRKDRSDLFPHHLANNLLQHLYYLPSNHQPLLTFASLPDLFKSAETIDDMEGDTYSEKYLERYVRSLPYWWIGEWDGHIAPRSYLPLLGSILLIVIGCAQIDKRKTWLAVLLGGLVITHSTLYAAIGQSGGRFIVIINWISMVFYGIGLAWLLTQIIDYIGAGEVGNWWVEENQPTSGEEKFFNDPIPQFVGIALLLLVVGLAHPLSVELLPERYTEQGLSERLSQAGLSDLADNGIENQVIVYGKALYPRYFVAGERMLDNRRGTVPDFSIERTEFYIVGSENVWAALPGDQGKEYLPHGSDVIVIGTWAPQIENEEGKIVSGEYLKASEVIIFDRTQKSDPSLILYCAGPDCEGR